MVFGAKLFTDCSQAPTMVMAGDGQRQAPEGNMPAARGGRPESVASGCETLVLRPVITAAAVELTSPNTVAGDHLPCATGHLAQKVYGAFPICDVSVGFQLAHPRRSSVRAGPTRARQRQPAAPRTCRSGSNRFRALSEAGPAPRSDRRVGDDLRPALKRDR